MREQRGSEGVSGWEGGRERGAGERSVSGAASPAGLTAQILTTAFPGADAASPGQARAVAALSGLWTGSPPLLL